LQRIAALPQVRIDRHQLANGLRVQLAPDGRAPIVAVNLWYDVGSRHEKPGKTGFAHLFEHMMFQGSANVGKGEHFSLVQAAGGSTAPTTSRRSPATSWSWHCGSRPTASPASCRR
jgi:predicted Zn-dependent peptidase